MRSFFLLLLSGLLLAGCSSTRQLEKRYTATTKPFLLYGTVKEDGNDKEAARLLPEAYRQAAMYAKP